VLTRWKINIKSHALDKMERSLTSTSSGVSRSNDSLTNSDVSIRNSDVIKNTDGKESFRGSDGGAKSPRVKKSKIPNGEFISDVVSKITLTLDETYKQPVHTFNTCKGEDLDINLFFNSYDAPMVKVMIYYGESGTFKIDYHCDDNRDNVVIPLNGPSSDTTSIGSPKKPFSIVTVLPTSVQSVSSARKL